MFRSLSIAIAAALAGVLGVSLPGTAAAGDGGECLELVSAATLACTPSDDDSAPLCEPTALMSPGDAHTGLLVSIAALPAPIAAEADEAGASPADAMAPDTIRVCPPGPLPAGHTCHVRAPYDAPPDQGGGAQAPSFDPWLLHVNDSTAPDPGRPVTVLAPAAPVHPGYARGPERPPPADAA